MERLKGSSIVEYAIPAALIAVVVGVSLFNVIQNTSLLNYFAFSGNSTVVQDEQKILFNKNTANSQILADKVGTHSPVILPTGSTPSDPSASVTNVTSTCNNGLCTVNMGSFTFQGVPENLQEIVETSGISAGTDVMVDIMNQLASQLEQSGQLTQSSDLKYLATTLHNMAINEKEWEKTIKSCNGDIYCVRNYISDESLHQKPSDFDESYYSYQPITTTDFKTSGYMSLGIGSYLNKNNSATYESSKNSNFLPALFYDKYQQMMNDSSLSLEVKNLVGELANQANVMGTSLRNSLRPAMEENAYLEYDFLTGEKIEDGSIPLPEVMGNISTVSIPTHFNATLVCAAGKGNDTGKKCY